MEGAGAGEEVGGRRRGGHRGWSIVAWVGPGLVGLYVVPGVVPRVTGGHAPGWQARCRRCGATRDAAEVGVMRVGRSVGKVSGAFGWCGKCRGPRAFTVERKPEAGQPPGATHGQPPERGDR